VPKRIGNHDQRNRNRYRADTLAIAKLVAAAEGITLVEAIADQLALFGSDQ
jgi:hypothetical protein